MALRARAASKATSLRAATVASTGGAVARAFFSSSRSNDTILIHTCMPTPLHRWAVCLFALNDTVLSKLGVYLFIRPFLMRDIRSSNAGAHIASHYIITSHRHPLVERRRAARASSRAASCAVVTRVCYAAPRG